MFDQEASEYKIEKGDSKTPYDHIFIILWIGWQTKKLN